MENSDDSSMEYFSSLPKAKWWGDNYLIQFDGFWFMPDFITNIDRVIKNFKPLPSDVILASFPKTGTTWLKSIIYSIVNRPSSEHDLAHEHPHELVPILEAQMFTQSTHELLSSTNKPYNSNLASAAQISRHRRRIFSTHIPYQLLTKTLDSSQCKVVYVTRNPKDTLVSFWHYANKWEMAKHEPWSYEEAVDKFCLGLVPAGPYYDHVLGYRDFSMKMPEKVFFITYEELINYPRNCVERLADFLGCPFDQEGEDKKEQVDQVVKMCSFDKLSNYEKNKSEESPTWCPILPYSSFFRKGGVGDHKNYLTEEDIERIDSLTREKFHSCCFMYGI